MKITSQLAVNFHWGALRPAREALKSHFGHAPRQDAPVKPDQGAWQRYRWFEFVSAAQMNQRLHTAAEAGDAARVRQLLKHPLVDPGREINGRTAGHWAAEAPHALALEALLHDPRFDVEAVDHHGGTLLHGAARLGRCEAIRLLLGEMRLETEPADERNETPLTKAVLNHQLEAARVLAMSDITPMATVEAAFRGAAEEGRLAMQAMLGEVLTCRGDSHAGEPKPGPDLPPLMCALTCGDQQGALDLLTQPGGEAHLDERTPDGRTPLMLAARHDPGLLKVILALQDIDPLHRDNAGWSPLMHAVDAGQREAVAWLLADGRFDLEGARDLALDLDKTELAQAILSAEEDVDALTHTTPEQRNVYAGKWDTGSPLARVRIRAAADRWKRETGQA